MNENEYIPSSAIPRTIKTSEGKSEYTPGEAIPRNPNRVKEKEGFSNTPSIPNNLEEVGREGWNAFREKLKTMSFSGIIDTTLNQAQKLRQSKSGDTPAEQDAAAKRNTEKMLNQVAEIDQLRSELESLNQDSNLPYFAGFENNKLSIIGKEAIANYKKAQGSGTPLTRLYLATPSGNSVKIFRALFDQLKNSKAIRDLNISLYLESVDARQATNDSDLSNPSNTNNIIFYIPDSDPAVIEEAVSAIQKSKETLHDLWHMEDWELANTKELFVRQLMVPLDDQVGMVEMPDLNSYHTATLSQEFPALFGTPYFSSQKIATKDMASRLSGWTPQNPGTFTLNSFPAADQRRRYMPALLFHKE